MSKKLLMCLIPISLVGCANTREEQGSVLMEDVVVQRTTMRSTTQNPSPKKGGGVYIQGDNITIGTLIVNSPNTQVDKSIKVVQTQQNNQSATPSVPNTHKPAIFQYPGHNTTEALNDSPSNYDNDRDFFKGLDKMFIRIIPSLIMMW